MIPKIRGCNFFLISFDSFLLDDVFMILYYRNVDLLMEASLELISQSLVSHLKQTPIMLNGNAY